MTADTPIPTSPPLRNDGGGFAEVPAVASGIAPLDAREGGLARGGSYLVVGPPGPAKMVAALQFLHRGIADGEPGLLVTNSDATSILRVARAWGFDMVDAWHDGALRILGFRDDFELRAIRSIAPEEVVEELEDLAGADVARVAVDPGALFLTGGAKTLLGAAFARWAFRHPGTVVSTFSVDAPSSSLPSSADWLLNTTTGRLQIDAGPRGLVQMTLVRPVPTAVLDDRAITLELKPGEGLVLPASYPARRGADRGDVDVRRLLVVALGAAQGGELRSWAANTFDADVVSDPIEAVTRLHVADAYGAVLVHATREQVRAAVQACRALRPLTRAAIVFASDDAVRSTDRIQILEAGADDSLSGGLDFRELEVRIRQAIAAGAKPARDPLAPAAVPSGPADGVDGAPSVPRSVLAAEVERRAADLKQSFFCLLQVTADLERTELADALAGQVRREDGDLVSPGTHGCLVLLQGARASQIEPFLRRIRTGIERRTGRVGSDVGIEVLSHPADRGRIRELVETPGVPES